MHEDIPVWVIEFKAICEDYIRSQDYESFIQKLKALKESHDTV